MTQKDKDELNLLREKEKTYNKLNEIKNLYNKTHDKTLLKQIEEYEGYIYGINLQLEGLRHHSN